MEVFFFISMAQCEDQTVVEWTLYLSWIRFTNFVPKFSIIIILL